MPSTEFMILAGMVVAGLIFFLLVQTFIFGWGGETKEYIYKAEAESIVSIVERVSSEPNEFVLYCQNIILCNIDVKNGILTYEKDEERYSFLVPKSVNDMILNEIATICILKSEEKVSLLSERPACVLDNVCALDECKEDCPDCYGPADMCKGDVYCNKAIGENCYTSPTDCPCDVGKVCCLESPDGDGNGCSVIKDKAKGEECWCTNQCQASLECNPTAKTFAAYKKACCEPGKSWDGSKCIVLECKYPCESGCIPPERFDWRDVDGKNWLPPIRSQMRCGSCWAFSAVGAMEGTYNVEQGTAVNTDLSEQDLVSCSGGDCNGWLPHLAYDFIKTKGICDENCFPYQSGNCINPVTEACICSCASGRCAKPCTCDLCPDANSRLWKMKDYGPVSSNLEEIKRAIVCQGPLSATSFNWGHAVVLVGYDNSRGWWIIRNSWGTGWGDSGYGHIPYSGHSFSDLKNYVLSVEGVRSP